MSEKRCGNCCNRESVGVDHGRCRLTLTYVLSGEGFDCPSHNLDVGALREEVERLRRAIDDCFEYANNRQSEWGSRAERCFEILEQAISPSPDDAKEGQT